MATRTRLREAVRSDPLAGVGVADDDPYAGPGTSNPYLALVNPYAAANPYAVAGDAPSTGTPPGGTLDADRLARRRPRPRRIIKRTVVMLPGSARSTMLWAPAGEYYRCFEEWYDDTLWRRHDCVDFSEAAESAYSSWDYDRIQGASLEDAFCIGAIPIHSEVETFDTSYMPSDWGSPLWSDLMGAIGDLRAELVENPTPIAGLFDVNMANALHLWLGGDGPRGGDDVLAAIATDPMNGAGGAALDFCTWFRPEAFGRAGMEIKEYIDGIEQDEYVWMEPIDNFIFDPAALHPETRSERYYNLYGIYEVEHVAYHSDPNGQGVTGFRSLFMRPYGVPVRPGFSE